MKYMLLLAVFSAITAQAADQQKNNSTTKAILRWTPKDETVSDTDVLCNKDSHVKLFAEIELPSFIFSPKEDKDEEEHCQDIERFMELYMHNAITCSILGSYNDGGTHIFRVRKLKKHGID